MGNSPALVLAALVGTLLGLVYFAGLWWTVQKGLTSDRPALIFLGSLVVRTAVVVVGFIVISHGQVVRLISCLLGFAVARMIVVRRVMPTIVTSSGAEARDAH